MVASAFMKLWTQLLVIMNTHKELECNKYAAIQTFLIIMNLRRYESSFNMHMSISTYSSRVCNSNWEFAFAK